jgi:hypothetical protein
MLGYNGRIGSAGNLFLRKTRTRPLSLQEGVRQGIDPLPDARFVPRFQPSLHTGFVDPALVDRPPLPFVLVVEVDHHLFRIFRVDLQDHACRPVCVM